VLCTVEILKKKTKTITGIFLLANISWVVVGEFWKQAEIKQTDAGTYGTCSQAFLAKAGLPPEEPFTTARPTGESWLLFVCCLLFVFYFIYI
jgi:hypothetical protein